MPTAALPVTLVANTNENVNDLNTDLNYIINLLNTLDESNIALLSAAFTAYRRVEGFVGQSAGLTAATYVLTSVSNFQLAGGNQAGMGVFYLDSARYPVGTKTPKLSLAASWQTNTVAPAITYTYGLYPITAVAGGANANTVTLGTVVTGSTITNTTPGASSSSHNETTDFAFPSAGFYCLGMVTSGTEAANATVVHRLQLQFRGT